MYWVIIIEKLKYEKHKYVFVRDQFHVRDQFQTFLISIKFLNMLPKFLFMLIFSGHSIRVTEGNDSTLHYKDTVINILL